MKISHVNCVWGKTAGGSSNRSSLPEITRKVRNRYDLADEIAAFANVDGGVLLCGLTEKGDVQDLSREQMDELERLLVDICADSIKPSIRPVILRRIINERALLLMEVPQGYAQHDSPGGSYHRVGSSKRRMTSDERLRLAQRRSQARVLWFDKQAVPNTGFGTLDEILWKPLLSAEGATDPSAALEKMGVLSRSENGVRRATVTGVLLCSSAPEDWLPNACIMATCYRGKDRATGQVDAQIIGGPLKKQIAEAVAFAVRNMRVAAHKTPARADLRLTDADGSERLVRIVDIVGRSAVIEYRSVNNERVS